MPFTNSVQGTMEKRCFTTVVLDPYDTQTIHVTTLVEGRVTQSVMWVRGFDYGTQELVELLDKSLQEHLREGKEVTTREIVLELVKKEPYNDLTVETEVYEWARMTKSHWGVNVQVRWDS